jgi:hypothetical protein
MHPDYPFLLVILPFSRNRHFPKMFIFFAYSVLGSFHTGIPYRIFDRMRKFSRYIRNPSPNCLIIIMQNEPDLTRFPPRVPRINKPISMLFIWHLRALSAIFRTAFVT